MTARALTINTLAQAKALCAALDRFDGFPRVEKADIGPDVYTERWTVPIEMNDGTYSVIVHPRHESELGKAIATAKRAQVITAATIKQRPEL
jgi:preprotein translocase subunit SecD